MPLTSLGPDFTAVRAAEYPWADSAIYLNAASFGPIPSRCLCTVEELNRQKHEGFRLLDRAQGDALVQARQALARLVGAAPEEIALAPNTSCGLNLAAGIVQRAGGLPGAGRRRRIILSDREFPANVYPWLTLEQDGLTVERVPTDALGRPREEALLERLEAEDVAVFALSAVQFATGYRADLSRFGRVCRERGILFVVDAIQALGAVPLDVRDSNIDILASGGQKWLCGPFGTGFTYVRSELCAELEPPMPGWLSFTASTDFTRLLDYRYELLPDARRFEVGTLAFQDFLGLARSVELLLELGPDEVWRHIRAVQEPLLAWVREREDVVVASDLTEERRSGIVCIRPRRAEDVHAALQRAGVVCVLREGAIRLSPHFYNTVAEMERVVEVLEETLHV